MVTTMLGALVAFSALSGELALLDEMPLSAILWFTAASLVHYLLGWTLFAVS